MYFRPARFRRRWRPREGGGEGDRKDRPPPEIAVAAVRGIGLALVLACQPGLRAGQEGRSAAGAAPGVRSFHVQGQVWVIAGAGGNVLVQAADAKAAGPGAGEGVLVVDTGATGMTGALLAEESADHAGPESNTS